MEEIRKKACFVNAISITKQFLYLFGVGSERT